MPTRDLNPDLNEEREGGGGRKSQSPKRKLWLPWKRRSALHPVELPPSLTRNRRVLATKPVINYGNISD